MALRPATNRQCRLDIAIADFNDALRMGASGEVGIIHHNRGASKQALDDIDAALKDINEAIRVDPALPQPLTNRAVIWRAKGDLDREVQQLLTRVRAQVVAATRNQQVPWSNSSLPGEVFLAEQS